MNRYLTLLLSIACVVGGIAPASAKPLNDSIVAIVNSDVITLKDLKDYIAGIYRQLQVENHSTQEIQEIMATYEQKGIEQLIEDRLILAAAKEKGIEIRPEATDKRLKEIKSKYPSEEDFITALGRQGMTVTDLKTKMINQMKAGYIVDIEVKQKIFVNPQDVTNYYNAHADEFTRKTKYSLQSIYISFNDGKQQARNRAAEAKAKLAAGEDFEKISKEYSELPSVGSIEQGQMVPEIEKVIFELKVDQISDLVEVEGGVYVFRVTGILPGRVETLKEAKDRVHDKLYDDQFKVKFSEWMKKLRQKNYVEIRD